MGLSDEKLHATVLRAAQFKVTATECVSAPLTIIKRKKIYQKEKRLEGKANQYIYYCKENTPLHLK